MHIVCSTRHSVPHTSTVESRFLLHSSERVPNHLNNSAIIIIIISNISSSSSSVTVCYGKAKARFLFWKSPPPSKMNDYFPFSVDRWSIFQREAYMYAKTNIAIKRIRGGPNITLYTCHRLVLVLVLVLLVLVLVMYGRGHRGAGPVGRRVFFWAGHSPIRYDSITINFLMLGNFEEGTLGNADIFKAAEFQKKQKSKIIMK
ncbi:hypothetical protein BX070DRAFT_68720 [Coemansia spiralis]|nr:hypothetical protein BX070DRAFT_68720 [Coemansia spiralis]